MFYFYHEQSLTFASGWFREPTGGGVVHESTLEFIGAADGVQRRYAPVAAQETDSVRLDNSYHRQLLLALTETLGVLIDVFRNANPSAIRIKPT